MLGGIKSSFPKQAPLISLTRFAAHETAEDALDIVPGLDVIATGREGWAARLFCGAML